jgi:hypothetical protein
MAAALRHSYFAITASEVRARGHVACENPGKVPRSYVRVLAVLSVAMMVMAGGVALVHGARATPVRGPLIAIACRSFIREMQTRPRIERSVPASVLARFGVLRRAQQTQDIPPADAGLRQAITGPFTSYDPALIRRLGAVPGGAIYVVSGESSPPRISAACMRASSTRERLALQAVVGELPAGPGYCLLEYAPSSLGRESCGTYATAEHGAPPGSDSYGRSTSYLDLVPDGVGGVTLTYEPAQPAVALTVADNLASGLAPAGFTSVPSTLAKHPSRLRRFLKRTLPTSVIWLTAPGGAVVRTFPRKPGTVEGVLREIEAIASSS